MRSWRVAERCDGRMTRRCRDINSIHIHTIPCSNPLVSGRLLLKQLGRAVETTDLKKMHDGSASHVEICLRRVLLAALCALPATAIVLLVQNAPETELAGWTLGVCSVLVLCGFVACAGAMHELDEQDEMWSHEVGGGMVGLGAALPVLIPLLLWIVLCAIILIGRAVKSERAFTAVLGYHALAVVGTLALGCILDANRSLWVPLTRATRRRVTRVCSRRLASSRRSSSGPPTTTTTTTTARWGDVGAVAVGTTRQSLVPPSK